MTGTLHRVIRLAGRPGEVRVTVEDDFHHFRVRLHHDGTCVTAVGAEGLRSPYTLCPAAGGELVALVGMPLSTDPTAALRVADARQQCTHQIDIAALAVAAAARGTLTRRYDIAVPDAMFGVERHARLKRDGVELLDWVLDGYAIAAPLPFAGLGLGTGFTDWVANRLDDEAAEAALVLRRGVFVAGGRPKKEWLDSLVHSPASGGCWVQQPAQHERALRIRGSSLDFTGRAELLAGEDGRWLAFDGSDA